MKARTGKRFSKAFAIFMTVLMLTGMIPQMAFAEDVAPIAETCVTEGCEYVAGHEGNCSNYIEQIEPCANEGCEYAANHEGDCSNATPKELSVESKEVAGPKQAAAGITISSGVKTSLFMNEIVFKNLSGSAENTGTNTYEVTLDPTTDITKPIEIEYKWNFAAAFISKNFMAIKNGDQLHVSKNKAGKNTTTPLYSYEKSGNIFIIKYNTKTDDDGINYFVPNWENGEATLQLGYSGRNTTMNGKNTVTVVLKIGKGEAVNQQPSIIGEVQKKETVDKNKEQTFDVTEKFADPEGETLTYFYAVDSNKEEDFKELPDGKLTMKFTKDNGTSGDYILYFKAFDGEKYSPVYTIDINVINNKPVLGKEYQTNETMTAFINEQISIDWTGAFTDNNDDPITYRVEINGERKHSKYESTKYTCVYGIPGTYEFKIIASDGTSNSEKAYTVTAEVKEPEAALPNFDMLYDVTVNVPQNLIPQFHITKAAGYNAVDVYDYDLAAEKGTTTNGFIEWTVKVPENIDRISYRAVDAEGNNWGGMSIVTKDENGEVVETVTLRQLKGLIKTQVEGQALTEEQGEFKVKTYEGGLAASGDSGVEDGYLYYRYLLAAYDNEATYTYYATPKGELIKTYSEAVADFNPITPSSAEVDVYPLPFNIAGGFTIIAPEDADVKVFNQESYYRATEQPCLSKTTTNKTTTWTFAKIANGTKMSYRVSMEGKVTKIGYVTGDSVTITWDDNDISPTDRVEYDLNTTYGKRAEDSIYLNVNGQNSLALDTNETFTLRPFRGWQLVNSEVDNIMIEPDFTYNVISGSDVISIAPISEYNMNATNNRLQINAKSSGVAIVEIGYNAVAFEGGEESVYEGTGWEKTFQGKMNYGAVDPARAGLVIVQVGNAATDVDFGIQFVDSANRTWDAEHDTIYFLGDKGQISFAPTVGSDSISEVAVSNDKGATWEVLIDENGVYTADIVSGNNIIRVKKADGTEAYQVVRGDKLTVTLIDSNNNGKVEAGEKITVQISGMHYPASKMSGIYNPGGVTTSYDFNGKLVSNQTSQYQCSQTSLEVTVPNNLEEGAEIRLSNGKVNSGWMGDTIGAHREITDNGKNMNGSASSRNYSFNIMPDIIFAVGDDTVKVEQDQENREPVRKTGIEAVGEDVKIKIGEVYKLSLGAIFEDADGDKLNYSVSVNGSEAESASKNYSFVPTNEGEYTLVFTANDGKVDGTDTYTVKVLVEGVATKPEIKFDLDENEIAGWVTVSFEDYGVRLEKEMDDIDVLYREPLGDIIEEIKVPFAKYDTIASVTLRLLDALDMYAGYNGTEYSGFYLSSIGKFVVNGTYYESFGEKQAGDGSGWMVTLNKGGKDKDRFIDRGANAFVVGDGDVIKWKYSCQIGADINGKNISDVIDLIDAIDKVVTLDSASKITAARAAYNALSEEQQAEVTNYDKLVAAEETLAKLLTEAKKESYEDIYKKTGTYLKTASDKTAPVVNAVGGEWLVLGLTRSGQDVPAGYYDNVVKHVKENINDAGQLHPSKSADNSRVILALTSAGIDPRNVDGRNLLEGLTDMSYVKKQGINGPIYALVALDSHDYEIPEGGDVTREALVETILAAQLTDGGWALSGETSDVDMTAMAIQALAPYYNDNDEVKVAVDKALDTLSKMQLMDGTFGSIDGACAESCAQVIVALTALGIDPEEDDRFTKNKRTVVDGLLSFALEFGGFRHVAGSELDGMATEQGYYALAAYDRFIDGKTSLYDMSDVTITAGGTSSGTNTDDVDKNESAGSKTKTKSIKLKLEEVTKEQLAQGRENHYCEETGIDARDNSNDILPWYIKLNVVKQEITDDQKAKVSEALGGEGEVFILKDIHFTNTKDGSEWQPTKPVKIKIPMVDIGDYENAVIVHITDDGKIELIKGTVKDGMIEFEADSFSLYGIAGTNTSINDLLVVEDDGAVVWPWIVIAIIALAAIAYLAYRRKHEA